MLEQCRETWPKYRVILWREGRGRKKEKERKKREDVKQSNVTSSGSLKGTAMHNGKTWLPRGGQTNRENSNSRRYLAQPRHTSRFFPLDRKLGREKRFTAPGQEARKGQGSLSLSPLWYHRRVSNCLRQVSFTLLGRKRWSLAVSRNERHTAVNEIKTSSR